MCGLRDQRGELIAGLFSTIPTGDERIRINGVEGEIRSIAYALPLYKAEIAMTAMESKVYFQTLLIRMRTRSCLMHGGSHYLIGGSTSDLSTYDTDGLARNGLGHLQGSKSSVHAGTWPVDSNLEQVAFHLL